MVRNVNSQIKAHFIDPADSISTIGFPAISKLACATRRIHESASVWIFPFFAMNAETSALNSGMSVATNIALNIAFVYLAELLRKKKLLRSRPEVVSCHFKKVASDKAFA